MKSSPTLYILYYVENAQEKYNLTCNRHSYK